MPRASRQATTLRRPPTLTSTDPRQPGDGCLPSPRRLRALVVERAGRNEVPVVATNQRAVGRGHRDTSREAITKPHRIALGLSRRALAPRYILSYWDASIELPGEGELRSWHLHYYALVAALDDELACFIEDAEQMPTLRCASLSPTSGLDDPSSQRYKSLFLMIVSHH